VFGPQTLHYISRVLPAFARHLPAVTLYSHSVPATFGAASPWVSAEIVLGWCAVAVLRLRRSPIEIFAGALAVSTYVARTSFDYNLITAYGLLIVQLSFALVRPPRPAAATFGVLLLGLVAIAGSRPWFEGHPKLHVAMQVTWLIASAVLAIAVPGDDHGAVREQQELPVGS
jgi:hypothetical protein